MKATRSIATAGALLLVCASVSAYAHGGGNGGGNGGGMGGSGAMGASAGKMGGMSASHAHMSSKGLSNTNGRFAGDRDKGHARSSDRASLHTQSHAAKHGNKEKHVSLSHLV